MQYHHRRRHRLIWLVLFSLALAALVTAVALRPAPAVNETLPVVIETREAQP